LIRELGVAAVAKVHAIATYILVRGNGDALSIVFQIDHQDLASVIKELQNNPQ
jgi:hypothetical protein